MQLIKQWCGCFPSALPPEYTEWLERNSKSAVCSVSYTLKKTRSVTLKHQTSCRLLKRNESWERFGLEGSTCFSGMERTHLSAAFEGAFEMGQWSRAAFRRMQPLNWDTARVYQCHNLLNPFVHLLNTEQVTSELGTCFLTHSINLPGSGNKHKDLSFKLVSFPTRVCADQFCPHQISTIKPPIRTRLFWEAASYCEGQEDWETRWQRADLWICVE